MTITTSINAVGPVKATEMIQSARAEAAIAHRAGLHTVTMPVPASADSRAPADGRARIRPASRASVPGSPASAGCPASRCAPARGANAAPRC